MSAEQREGHARGSSRRGVGTLHRVTSRVGARELMASEDEIGRYRAPSRPAQLVPVGEVHAVDEDAEAVCGQGRMYVIGTEWRAGVYRDVCARCLDLVPPA